MWPLCKKFVFIAGFLTLIKPLFAETYHKPSGSVFLSDSSSNNKITPRSGIPANPQPTTDPHQLTYKSLPFKKTKKKPYIQPFPNIYNPEVKRWIDFFTQSDSYFKPWLKRSYRYFPLMEEIFKSRGLPKELVFMSLVESGLSAKALSSAQAVGYWQFIKPTGLKYGLRINHWIDERQDFYKSTVAASKYLHKLYKEFDNWLLAMAAYNMGETRLRRLIKKHGTKNFWILYKKRDFPRETALYVPKILATARIIKNPEFYGVTDFLILSPYSYEVFFTPGGTNLRDMALATQISMAKIKSLNPDLKSEVIPHSISTHKLRLPKGSGLLVSRWLEEQKN